MALGREAGGERRWRLFSPGGGEEARRLGEVEGGGALDGGTGMGMSFWAALSACDVGAGRVSLLVLVLSSAGLGA